MSREQAGARLGDQVVRRRVRERSRRAERADATDDQRRRRRVNVLPVQAEPTGALSREVVQHDVCLSEQPPARRDPVVALQVEHDRALAPVQRHEVTADSRRDGHDVPVAVTRGRLDLDDVRAEIGEEDTTQRPGDVLRVLDDANTFQRKAHRSPRPRRAMTVCRISAEPPEIVEPTDAR